MKRSLIVACCLLLLVLQASPLRANDASLDASSREFVQKFYEAYVPKARAGQAAPAWQSAIDTMSASFDEGLLEALKDDAAAQAKSSDESVGLDFDPFLNSQDPADGYEVGAVSQEGAKYFVKVYPVTSGKRSDEPGVVAELSYRQGRWLFANFRYPGNDDLLTILRVLKENRKSQQD